MLRRTEWCERYENTAPTELLQGEAVDTVAEARALIKRCKQLENCLCGEECRLTIEDVRKSSEGQP